MLLLFLVSIIWGLSFGLIKTYLTGLDPGLVAFLRLFLSLLVFLPFLRPRALSDSFRWRFFFLGMVQFGLMYVTYIMSYQYLLSYHVALFTIFTPLYVTLLNDLLRKHFNWIPLAMAVMATAGCFLVVYRTGHQRQVLAGFFLMQLSNLCFALGQVFYRRWMRSRPRIRDLGVFPLMYLGAVTLSLPLAFIRVPLREVSLKGSQVLPLLYLGVVASGICFFLWNKGVTRTDIGTVAIMNNLKIPLGVLFSIFLFREEADLLRLLAGGALLGLALTLNHRLTRKSSRHQIP